MTRLFVKLNGYYGVLLVNLALNIIMKATVVSEVIRLKV